MYYSGFSNRNLLIAVTYDEIGNPLSYRDSYQFTWQNGRRLATVSHGSDSISYTYNPDGIRTSKTVSGAVTKFHTMNSTLLGQTKGSDTIVFLYDEKGNKYGFDYNGTKYYYIFNVQGDVIGILNQSGAQIVSYQYDPWGKVLSVDGSEAFTIGQINPIRYRSYYYDTETGFYYLQSRYYDPTVRRFLNADNILGANQNILSYNLFAYCSNNPINYCDPSGCYMTPYDRLRVLLASGKAWYDSKGKLHVPYSSYRVAPNVMLGTPLTGEPNSTLPVYDNDGNLTQEREYGPDGRAKRDIDYGHAGHHPNLPSPHYHDWNWDTGVPTRGDAYAPFDWGQAALGTGLVVVCVIGIILVAADDATGVGVADNFLYGPLGVGVSQGLSMVGG